MEYRKNDDTTLKNMEFYKICCKNCNEELGYLQQGEEKIYIKTSSVQCPRCEMNYCCYKCAKLILTNDSNDLIKLLDLYETLHNKLFSDISASIEDEFNNSAVNLNIEGQTNLLEYLKNNVSCGDCRVNKKSKSKCLIV